MAKPSSASYFQRITARMANATPIRPASGLLARWAEVADIGHLGPVPSRRTVRPASGDEVPHALGSASQAPEPVLSPRKTVVARSEDTAEFHRAPAGPLTKIRPAQPHHEKAQRHQGASTPSAPPRPVPSQMGPAAPIESAGSRPMKPPASRQPAGIQTGRHETPPPALRLAPVAPTVKPTRQEHVPEKAAAARKVIQERMIERPLVMPASVQTPARLSPPAAKQAATVQIGTIEVKVIREVAPAPAFTPPHLSAKPPPATAAATQPSTPISRRLAVAHGFHQS